MPDGIRLQVEVDGAASAGVTVIFVHGYTLNIDSWIEQRQALVGVPACRVYYDSRAFGRSDRGSTTEAGIRQLATDLAAVIDATAPDGPVVLAGRSMGVMVVLALAGRAPICSATG